VFRPLSISIAVTALAAATVVSLACEGAISPSTGVAVDSRDPPSTLALIEQQSGTTNRLQAVSPVSPRIVWASGMGGTYTVTTDGGDTWRAGVVPDASDLEFRDVHGVSAREAYLLAAGEGEASRIYKTRDGGATWTLQFQNQEPRAFYDCFDFWTSARGITFSDAVDGRFPVIRTTNGRTWTDIGDQLPPAQEGGEAAFAASGTCVATQGGQRAWIATGAAAKARILVTRNGGDTWTAHDTPLVSGLAAGGFSVAFRDANHGILVGGDLSVSGPQTNNVAVSDDGGEQWTLMTATPFDGAAFGVSYAPGVSRRTVVATGPGGTAWSSDEGNTWTTLPGVTGFWAVAFASRRSGWLVGTEGRILKVIF
jgi:photosystem II stability/assembly factor-like uncharacterized protein